ncbi:hypothetical protein LEMA_P113160.1 [Plenodomus lingam JN3]|uniref:protein-ribulosamine 3-kinase n=1 Tax=Leptosphaeria maculans (strain JN3 / isolate v23.1.3 / race Av1-4-5-6-7-8) TaxID=985895 RepID=E4ZUW4_LEPMJ|nr:hypothetical protein LEMA_P113160.1 [Plenodomus lingam JN3]CBX94901.1 hypothetical protein LEMA_P113160.1 [Plenodomus lingam JN3]
MNPDPGILKLLGVDADETSISPSGRGGCSSATTSEIVSFLAIEFLHLTSRSTSKSRTAKSLATKLAKLHTTPAPVPVGYDKPAFVFLVTTFCGDTPQRDTFKESWVDFYAKNLLMFILGRAETKHGKDKDLRTLVENTAYKIAPQIIGDMHLNSGDGVAPVVVHGDLWSGNAGTRVIGNIKGEPEDVTYDPSACYAHSEYDLGAMKMFGGFNASFIKEYHELCPRTESVHEYEDRVSLYELYHHRNHYAMFGGDIAVAL